LTSKSILFATPRSRLFRGSPSHRWASRSPRLRSKRKWSAATWPLAGHPAAGPPDRRCTKGQGKTRAKRGQKAGPWRRYRKSDLSFRPVSIYLSSDEADPISRVLALEPDPLRLALVGLGAFRKCTNDCWTYDWMQLCFCCSLRCSAILCGAKIQQRFLPIVRGCRIFPREHRFQPLRFPVDRLPPIPMALPLIHDPLARKSHLRSDRHRRIHRMKSRGCLSQLMGSATPWEAIWQGSSVWIQCSVEPWVKS